MSPAPMKTTENNDLVINLSNRIIQSLQVRNSLVFVFLFIPFLYCLYYIFTCSSPPAFSPQYLICWKKYNLVCGVKALYKLVKKRGEPPRLVQLKDDEKFSCGKLFFQCVECYPHFD